MHNRWQFRVPYVFAMVCSLSGAPACVAEVDPTESEQLGAKKSTVQHVIDCGPGDTRLSLTGGSFTGSVLFNRDIPEANATNTLRTVNFTPFYAHARLKDDEPYVFEFDVTAHSDSPVHRFYFNITATENEVLVSFERARTWNQPPGPGNPLVLWSRSLCEIKLQKLELRFFPHEYQYGIPKYPADALLQPTTSSETFSTQGI